MNARADLRLAMAGALAVLSGCASLGNRKLQELPVASDPPGATASWDGQSVTTPGTLVVPRKAKNLVIRFEREGHRSCVVALERDTDHAVWANLAFIPVGMLVGGAIGYSGASKNGVFAGWGEAILGGVLGGVLVPSLPIAIDLGNGRGYEQNPAKVRVALTPTEPGRDLASPPENAPPCSFARPATPQPEVRMQ